MTAPFSHKNMLSMFKSGQVKAATQCAALCWRVKNEKVQILLITSRETKRWVIPKGWPMRGKTLSKAAEQEAWEEAGVIGKVRRRAVGVFGYRKRLSKDAVPCVAVVFPLKVKTLASRFPERSERKRKWVSRKKAARLVREPELARLILSFRPSELR